MHFLSLPYLQVIIVTSSLMKDMNSKTDLYRANAIRVLCRIIDGGLLGQIERYLKQAVVDKNPIVASAALVSGIHLLKVRTVMSHGRHAGVSVRPIFSL